MIWLLLGLALVLTLAYIAWFIYKPLSFNHTTQQAANVELAKLKLAELSNDVAIGTLSQTQFEQAKLDISQTLTQEIKTQEVASNLVKNPPKKITLSYRSIWLNVIGVFIMVSAIGLYQSFGTGDITQRLDSIDAVNTIEELEGFVDRNPDNSKALKMLAYGHFANNNLEKSAQFYHQAYEANTTDVEILVEYASVLAALQNNSLAGQPAKLIQQALIVDNNNMTALYLAGLAAYQQGELALTKKAWQRAISQVNPENPDYKAITEQLQNLEAEILANTGTKPIVNPIVNPTTNPATKTDKSSELREVAVSVSLSKTIVSKTNPNDFVLIYAKNATGRPAPLAIVRKQVKDLPLTIALNDTQAMIANINLSSAGEIVVVARISKTGKAFKQADDIEAVSTMIDLSKTPKPSVTLILQ